MRNHSRRLRTGLEITHVGHQVLGQLLRARGSRAPPLVGKGSPGVVSILLGWTDISDVFTVSGRGAHPAGVWSGVEGQSCGSGCAYRTARPSLRQNSRTEAGGIQVFIRTIVSGNPLSNAFVQSVWGSWLILSRFPPECLILVRQPPRKMDAGSALESPAVVGPESPLSGKKEGSAGYCVNRRPLSGPNRRCRARKRKAQATA